MPSNARIADLPEHLQRPVLALWVSLLLSPLAGLLDLFIGALSSASVASGAVATGVLCFIPFFITKGQHLARLVYAIVVALNISVLLFTQAMAPFTAGLAWLTLPLDLWVLHALFRRESRPFFLRSRFE